MGEFEFESLFVCCRHGDIARARDLLERGLPVDWANRDGLTALHAAARGGHLPVAKLLLEHGAQLEHPDSKGGTPLMRACRHGHAQLAAALLDAGASQDNVSDSGYSALMLAASSGHGEVVRLLCERGADVRVQAQNGATALSLAVESGQEGAAVILRAQGALRSQEALTRRHAECAHLWWYRPLLKGASVAEPVSRARAARTLRPPSDAPRSAQCHIDRAMREGGLPHDGGRWRTRAVADVVRSEQAGARLTSARHATDAFAQARALRIERPDARAGAAGLPKPYRSHAEPLPMPLQHQPRARRRPEAPAW